MKSKEEIIYTCPMHDYVKKNSSGICPIYRMKLVKKFSRNKNAQTRNV